MRVLVFSDIHGNAYALERFLQILPQISYDCIVFLGDIFGYYYEQKKCIEWLKGIPNLVWLKGNHDSYAIMAYNDKKQEKKLVASYGHSYNALQERFTLNEMEFMDKLPTKYEFEYVGKKIAFFHGRPLDMLEGRFYQDTECAKKEFAPYDVVFLGHTHCKIDRIVGKTRVICPGSLGQPRDGMGYGFAIFNLEDGICQYRNVSVNNKLLRRDIEQKDANLQKLYEVLSREERTDEKVKSIKI